MTHRKLTELLGCRGQINRLGSPDCKSRAPHSAPLPFTPHGGSTAYGVGAQPYLLTRLLFPRVHQLNKNVVFRVTVNLVFVGGGVAGSVSLLARHASYARGNPNVDFIRDTLPTICSRRHPRASEQSIPDNLKASRTNGVVRIT